MFLNSKALLLVSSVALAVREGTSQLDPDFGVTPECTITIGCWDDEYCMQGQCAVLGSCIDDYDCLNPYNDFNDSKCKGYIRCNKNVCERKCDGKKTCANGNKQAACIPGYTGCDQYNFPPPGAILCTNDSCNNCEAVYYDAAGFVVTYDEGVDPEFGVEAPYPIDPEFGVETPIDPEFGVEAPIDPGFGVEAPIDPEFGVEAPIDPEFGVDAPIDPEFGVNPPGPPQNCLDGVCPVGDGAYCDDTGNCLLLGKCTTKDDCFNLYNDPYPASMCIGDIICQAGLCIKDCDPIMAEFDCSNPDNAPNVVEVVCADKELSLVCDLLNDSENKEVYKWLTDPKKKYTLFAPVNSAVENLPAKYDTNIKYHLVKGRASFARDLSCLAGNNLVTMVDGKDTRTKCKKDIPFIQQGKGNSVEEIYPEFLDSDIIACNGLIHKISNVLLRNPK